MLTKKQQTTLIAAGILVVILSGIAWWRIFTTTTQTTAPTPAIVNPLTDDVFPVLPVDPPKDAGTVLTTSKLKTKFYLASNGKRYVFPDDTQTYATWKSVLGPEKEISQAELEAYPLGGNVWYRPGTRLIKIESDPRIYAVARGGVLREVNEGNAALIFGSDWRSSLDVLQDYYFTNYTIGEPITSPRDYSKEAELGKAPTIDHDKGLK